MEIIISEDADKGSITAARVIARQVKEKPDSVLGLATGSTPIRLYQELIRLHQEEGLDFAKVRTFNLDEYVGLAPTHAQSYFRFMQEQLFQHLNIKEENVHIPDGMAADIPKHCADYEAMIVAAGGIDIQDLWLHGPVLKVSLSKQCGTMHVSLMEMKARSQCTVLRWASARLWRLAWISC